MMNYRFSLKSGLVNLILTGTCLHGVLGAQLDTIARPNLEQISQWQTQLSRERVSLIEVPVPFEKRLYFTDSDLRKYSKSSKTPQAIRVAIKNFLSEFKQTNLEQLSAPHAFIPTNLFPESFFDINTAGEDTAPAGLQELIQVIFKKISSDYPQLSGWRLEVISHPKYPITSEIVYNVIKCDLQRNETAYKIQRLRRSLGPIPNDAEILFKNELNSLMDMPDVSLTEAQKTLLVDALELNNEADTFPASKRIHISAGLLRYLFFAATIRMPWTFDKYSGFVIHRNDENKPEFREGVENLLQSLTFVVLHECAHITRGDGHRPCPNEVECDLWGLAELRRVYGPVNVEALMSVISPLAFGEDLEVTVKGDVFGRPFGELIEERKTILLNAIAESREWASGPEVFNRLLLSSHSYKGEDVVLTRSLANASTRPRALLELMSSDDFSRQVALILIGELSDIPDDLRSAVVKATRDMNSSIIYSAIKTAKKLAIKLPDPRQDILKAVASYDSIEQERGLAMLSANWKATRIANDWEQAQRSMFRFIVDAYGNALPVVKKRIARFVKSNKIELEDCIETEYPKFDEPQHTYCQKLLEEVTSPISTKRKGPSGK